jgi:orotidine-5'-phosphate decarboxylase
MVTGATGPAEARAIRNLAPKSLFLVPGYGAQGAPAADAMAGFVQGPSGLEGGVVSASRSVNFPAGSDTAENIDAWTRIVQDAIAVAQADLKGVMAPA